MNHLEAQSYIMPFIDGQIPPEKQEEFVMHMHSCPKCHEELEVYYTLMTGMKQLDGNEKLSGNFAQDLDEKLSKTLNRARGRQGVRVSAFSIVMAAVLILVALLYTSCISTVYAYEQETKLLSQGEYYFYNRLGNRLFKADRDFIEEGEELLEVEETTSYEYIRGYNRLRDDYLRIFDIGEEIVTYEAPVN